MLYKLKKEIIILLISVICFSMLPMTGIAADSGTNTSSEVKWSSPTKKKRIKNKKKKSYIEKLKKKSSRTKTITKSKKISSKTTIKIAKDKSTKTKTVVKKTRITAKNYKKGSKKVKVSITIRTTTTIYTYKNVGNKNTSNVKNTSKSDSNKKTDSSKDKSQVQPATDKTSKEKQYQPGIYDIEELAPKADSNVLSAFKTMGIVCRIDPSCAATGLFSINSRLLELKYYGTHVYHELGHFLFFVAGRLDTTAEATLIYQAEEGKVTAYNKAYTNSSVREYFAEAYLSYILDRNNLKNTRPQTYAYVQKAVNAVTESKTKEMMKAYASLWN